ncbi:ribosomal RNA small subunit methyltransferase C [Shewanella algicola]|uniref:Ribosomal RNA small subunit methyltransferase C n=1 Tax=Shewanella algicola TaxID=640633 RepID=A0A9X1Z7Z6_9GAMM|nr:class I SAM-dependent methyltransferase [Shewanella algicola]MCL1106924.1 class I SAM-dependent methyltransferase [Shewanella algicola]GGP63369.1 ribosomal RNA small subunit methyltransferase C [Shewanella algicola]
MLTNPSQALIRNSELFQQQKVLILNYEADTFASQCLESASHVTALAFDFNHHQTLSPYANNTLECYFGHQLPDNLANEKYDCVIIYFPKAKPLMGYLLQLAAQHMAIDGLLVVVGENKGGVKSIAKLMPAYFSAPIKQDNARHCLLYTSYLTQAAPPLLLTDWLSQYTLDTPQGQLQICNLVGVFSEKRLDQGTELLLSHLPDNLQGRILDFGCGAGVISAALLKANPQLNIECIDINAMALASCQLTLAANNMQAKVYPSDGFNQITGQFNAIISNPPFHDGLTSTTDIATQFVKHSASSLAANGIWQIVANRHLPYSDTIAAHFGKVNVQAENNRYKLYLHQV